MDHPVIIIGGGLAGLTAAITLAEQGQKSVLVSSMPSERSQSVLAEGGINAALDLKGEDDSPQQHFQDTMDAGKGLEDPKTIQALTEAAPGIIRWLETLGVPFQTAGFDLDQRSFGGQKKKRTCYVKSSIGKMLMTALIDETRKYEAQGLVVRIPSGILSDLIVKEDSCFGCVITDRFTGENQTLYGPVLLATGGMNGLFGSHTTGAETNTGDAAACAFSHGVAFSDLEFIQYHPTTVPAAGKRLLISEAARGEGGRLYILRDGHPWYFMEEKYPTLGNLMPRDIVSREMFEVVRRDDCSPQVYLDLTGLPEDVWDKKLPDLRKECREYVGLDPAEKLIPVEPGIHYFMGGIYVDEHHRTSVKNLFAAGECAAIYHGANRLGGNSTLGAIYGGERAAETILSTKWPDKWEPQAMRGHEVSMDLFYLNDPVEREMQDLLVFGMGIERNEADLQQALSGLQDLTTEDIRHIRRILLAQGFVKSALFRKESRGSHIRTDYPQEDPALQKKTIVEYRAGEIQVYWEGENDGEDVKSLTAKTE